MITGDVSKIDRQLIVNQFNEGKINTLIITDVEGRY